MSDQAARVMLTVFQDDAPELYAYLESLPKNKWRRRDRLLRVLYLGMQAELAGASIAPPQGSTAMRELPAREPVVTQPAPEPSRPSPVAVAIAADDLASVFGR